MSETNAHKELHEKLRKTLKKYHPAVSEDSLLMEEMIADFAMAISQPSEKNECMVCQASLEKDIHPISRVMAMALIKVSRGVYIKAQTLPFTEANDIRISKLPKEIALTFDERGNFTKIRFHGLVAKVYEDDKRKSNCWLITKKGWAFLRGEAVPAKAITFRNNVIGHSPEMITIKEVLSDGAYSDTLETLERELATLPEDLQ